MKLILKNPSNMVGRQHPFWTHQQESDAYSFNQASTSDKLCPRFSATDLPLLQLDFPSGALVEASTSGGSKMLEQTPGGTMLP
jgi:hypothetical protein